MQELVWKYTVRVSFVEDDGSGNEDKFTGILIKSHSNPKHRHLLVNMHSFLDDNTNPVPGFPDGFEDEFKKVRDRGHASRGKGKKRKQTAETDPVKIRVEQLQYGHEQGSKTEKLTCLFEETIGEMDIKLCDGNMDALVLFDKEIPNTLAAPVFGEITRSQRVHLFGFAHLGKHEWFSVPGEVHSVSDGNVLITCLSVPGLSGGAVVCDGTGGVIAYSGGAQSGNDESPFGAYAYRMDLIQFLQARKDTEPARKKQKKSHNQ